VNAYYDEQLNDITFPLEPCNHRCLIRTRMSRQLWGYRGTIGHELTHAFDD